MLRLEDLIGKKVIIALERSKKASGYDITIHGVESGGLWIESEELARGSEAILPPPAKDRPTQKLVFFFPYAQIQFVMALSTDLENGS